MFEITYFISGSPSLLNLGFPITTFDIIQLDLLFEAPLIKHSPSYIPYKTYNLMIYSIMSIYILYH